MNEVTVDGVRYRWVIKYQDDPDAGSSSFFKRLAERGEKPFGLPWSHWWWKHGPRLRDDPHDD